MRFTIALFTVLVLMSIKTFSQTTEKASSFEFGAELISTSTFLARTDLSNYGLNHRALEYISGLFFKYYKNKVAIRAGVNHFNHAYNGKGSHLEINESSEVFKFRLGAQYSLMKKREWLYAFSDLQYMDFYHQEETRSNGWGQERSYSYETRSKGIIFIPGIGFTLKVLRQAYISSELGWGISNMNFSGKELVSVRESNGITNTDRIVKFKFGTLPEARIMFSVKF